MAKAFDVTGQIFGRLTALYRIPAGHRSNWFCRCICGVEKSIDLSALISGRVVSCGCNKREKAAARATHGESRPGAHTAEYKTWQGIKKRCLTPTYAEWKYYGGRGIKICARWRKSYEAFLADMGRKPSPQHSIDRIKVNGDYKPGNCRWATRAEQRNNRRDPYKYYAKRSVIIPSDDPG